MAQIEVPSLDPADEEALVAEVLDAMPAELSDRNPSSVVVKLTEALGALYGMTLYQLNRWPLAVQYYVLRLLGLETEDATAATAVVRFTRDTAGTPVTIPAGTVVKTGTADGDVSFETIVGATMSATATSVEVTAQATTTGARTNVAASSIVLFSSPIAGVDGVTNPEAATGGQDAQTVEDVIETAPQAIRTVDGERAITEDDFVFVSTRVAGISRAQARTPAPGFVTVDVLDETLNETIDAGALEDVADYIQARTVAGVTVEALAAEVWRVAWEDIEVELEDDVDPLEVQERVKTELFAYCDPYASYTLSSGVTRRGWPFGRSLTENDAVTVIGKVSGIRRVLSVTYRLDTGSGFGATLDLHANPIATGESAVLVSDDTYGPTLT